MLYIGEWAKMKNRAKIDATRPPCPCALATMNCSIDVVRPI